MSNIEHWDEEAFAAAVARLPGRRDGARNLMAQAMRAQVDAGYVVVRADADRGAVEDFREIDRLLVQATIELPSERAVTIERAIAVARRHLGGQ